MLPPFSFLGVYRLYWMIPFCSNREKTKKQMTAITNGPAVNQYMQTSAPSVFACGNVVHVNDLVDNVSEESARAGKYAARYAMGKLNGKQSPVQCVTGRNVRYLYSFLVKQTIRLAS